MFGRNKKTDEPAQVATALPVDDADGQNLSGGAGKGRPTPKRKDAQAARRQPLVPADRDAARKEAKSQSRVQRAQQREALARGDEKALPARDRGPVKRFIRDTVDARWNIGEILLPLMLLMLVMTVLPNRSFQVAALFLVWIVLAFGIIDSWLLWRRLKKRIHERFNEDPPRGAAMYAIMRAMQMRMSRMPKPQVKRGDKPR
ncbi:DUF3043 domain-containing protein [Calidifontibacter terrae]